MIKYRKEKQEAEKEVAEKIVCDVCKKEYSLEKNEDITEAQEFYRMSFTGGYGSVFGDGAKMSLDICQHCLKEKLGQYMVLDKENSGGVFEIYNCIE